MTAQHSWDTVIGNLAQCMHTGIGTPGAVQVDRFAVKLQQDRFQLALDRIRCVS